MTPKPILVRYGGRQLYYFVSFCLTFRHLNPQQAAKFLNEPAEDLKECTEEVRELLAAVKDAIESGITVDDIMKLESRG